MGTSSGAEVMAGVTARKSSCLAAPGRWQAEGRYVTTFSFSLEQYEAKSLEMISAYWSSTLLMVCSQLRAATKTSRQQQKRGRMERRRLSPTAVKHPMLGYALGPSDASGAARAQPLEARSSTFGLHWQLHEGIRPRAHTQLPPTL